MDSSKIFADERVDGHRDQEHQNEGPQQIGVEVAEGAGSQKGEDKGSGSGGQKGFPVQRYVAGVAPHRNRGAGNAGELARSENGGHGHVRQKDEQSRQLNQTSASHHRIDQASQKRKEAKIYKLQRAVSKR